MESSREREQPPQFEHISALLRFLDGRLLELHDEAGTRLVDCDSEGYDRAIRSQTEFIAGFAACIESFKSGGGTVPEEVEEMARYHSDAASHALEEGSEYPRAALLPLSRNTRKNSPTILKLLAISFGAGEKE